MDLLAVQVNGDRVAVRENWKSPLRDGLRQANAHLVPGQDQDPHLTQVFVASRVVAVDVGVDDEADLGLGDLFYSRDDPVRERRELIVDHDDAVHADRDADVAAPTLEIIDASGHMVGLDHNVVEVGLGAEHSRRERRYGDYEEDAKALRPRSNYVAIQAFT